jgi:molecular chaperone GrpE
MSDEAANGGEEPMIKVVDRRRFRADGEPNGSTSGLRDDATGQTADGEAPPVADAMTTGAKGEMEAKLAQQAARIDELTRAYASLVEDNKAFRTRMEREKERVVGAEKERVAQALLDTADELERALAAVSEAGAPSAGVLATLADGVRLTLAGLTKRIAELGAERLVVVGERFDPRLAEAVDTVPVADEERDGVVLQEVRPGYRIGERILRPARVRVGRLARA